MDKELRSGDAQVGGRAVPAADDEFELLAAAAAAKSGGVPPGRFPLFRVDLAEASLLRLGPGGDHLLIEWWRPGAGVPRVERR